jgi:hypothetical protein
MTPSKRTFSIMFLRIRTLSEMTLKYHIQIMALGIKTFIRMALGIMTYIIMVLGIMTFIVMALSIMKFILMAFSIMPLRIKLRKGVTMYS